MADEKIERLRLAFRKVIIDRSRRPTQDKLFRFMDIAAGKPFLLAYNPNTQELIKKYMERDVYINFHIVVIFPAWSIAVQFSDADAQQILPNTVLENSKGTFEVEFYDTKLRTVVPGPTIWITILSPDSIILPSNKSILDEALLLIRH